LIKEKNLMRILIFAFFLFIPLSLCAQSDYHATSIYFWGGLDIINAHASGAAAHPLAGIQTGSSAGGFGGGVGILFALDQRSAIGLETGYLLTEAIADAWPSITYTEFILPVLLTGQIRIIGLQGTSGMSVQGGMGLGVLYRTEASISSYITSASMKNNGTGFLGYVGPQAELVIVRWFSLEATARYYFTSMEAATGKSMFYFGIGCAFTF
jgi:hypothetical protein